MEFKKSFLVIFLRKAIMIDVLDNHSKTQMRSSGAKIVRKSPLAEQFELVAQLAILQCRLSRKHYFSQLKRGLLEGCDIFGEFVWSPSTSFFDQVVQ